jgi:hypothetical protein
MENSYAYAEIYVFNLVVLHLQGAIERIRLLRSSGLVDDNTPVVAVEGFVVEVMKNRYFVHIHISKCL